MRNLEVATELLCKKVSNLEKIFKTHLLVAAFEQLFVEHLTN